MRRNLNTQDGGNLRQKMLIKLFINHLGFVTNDYEQGYYSLNRNGFFIEIVFQVKIRSTSLCIKKKIACNLFLSVFKQIITQSKLFLPNLVCQHPGVLIEI